MTTTAEMKSFLISRRWRYVERFEPWAWQDPHCKAWYRLRDAYDLEISRQKAGKAKTA